jgi:hypothetical protein
MKKIIVGFSHHPGSIFSWLIRTATKSEVSHAYIRIPVEEYKQDVIFQASGLTVNYCNGEVFLKKNGVVEEYVIEISNEQAIENERSRITECGKPYSMNQIYGCLWVLAMRQIGKRVPNPFSDGMHSYVCVEITADQVGIADGESMTPEDMRRWCARHGTLIQ